MTHARWNGPQGEAVKKSQGLMFPANRGRKPPDANHQGAYAPGSPSSLFCPAGRDPHIILPPQVEQTMQTEIRSWLRAATFAFIEWEFKHFSLETPCNRYSTVVLSTLSFL